MPSWFKTAAITGALALVLSYSAFQARGIIEGPELVVFEPAHGSLVTEPLIEIVGRAKNVSEITLNDRHIFIDEEGRFREQLLLPQGYTIMTLGARDRFGRETTHVLELVRR